MFFQATDYETAGRNKLQLIRYYNSMALPDSYATSLGSSNWRTNYDRYLHIFSHGVEAERADGQVINFSSSSGIFTPDSDVDMTLTVSGSTWTLTDHNDTSEVYYSSGSDKGVLQSITARNGYTQALIYTSGQISYVSDSYDRQLGFSYSSSGLLTNVTTPDTLTLTYGYDSPSYYRAGRLASVSFNTSSPTSQSYLYEDENFPFALTGITDENGIRYESWGYDSWGRATLSQLSGAIHYTSVYYNDTTGDRVVKGPLGIFETYKFSTLQGVPKVTEIDRAANGTVATATETFSYDSNGYLASKTDWNGTITAYTNNSHGLPTQIVYASTTANAQTTNITYDSTWVHLPATIDSQGLNSSLSYDSSGNLLFISSTDMTSQSVPYSTNGTTRTWSYGWDSTGQLLSAQLPRTDVTAKTTYSYDGGTLTAIEDALGHTTSIVKFQSGGLPLTVYDPNGVRRTYGYTTRNWIASTTLYTSAGTLTTSFDYDSAGNLTKSTLPDSSYLSYGYNDARQLTSITNALAESAAITYDSAGNVTQELWKDSGGTTKRQHSATYDALGRKLTDVGGEGQTTHFTYDDNGNIETVTDPLGNISYRSVDALNRLTRAEDAELSISYIAYDSHSRPLTVTDPRGNDTTYVYDGFGDAIQIANPDTLTTVYYYDDDSNLTKQVDARSVETDLSYDALDRLTARTYPAASALNVAIYYDSTGHGYGVGRLTGTSDQIGALSRTYDERGNILFESRTSGSHTWSTGYTYESAGRLSSITYASSGWVVSYERDGAGQITYVSATDPTPTTVNVAADVTHLPFGPASGWTYGNGVTDTRSFDQDYRMTVVRDTGTSGDIQYLSYGYNDDNRVTGITDHVASANNYTFDYDATGQLTYASGPFGTGSVSYISNGNRLTAAGVTYTYPSDSDRFNKWGASTSITYTSSGNIASIGADVALYNKANQLAIVTIAGTSYSYGYDAFGQRTWRKDGSNPTALDTYDLAGRLLTEANGASLAETDYAYMDGLPIAVIDPAGGTVAALHTDHIGTVTAATNSSQATAWACVYAPFGACTPSPASITQNLRLPGQYADATGLNHNGFRDFNKTFGRYLEPDPLGLAGAFSIYPSSVVNGYPYALNNPVTNTDPWGLCPPNYPDCVEAFPSDEAMKNALLLLLAAEGATTPFGEAADIANLPKGQICRDPAATHDAQPLYHYTTESNAQSILEKGLEPGLVSKKVFTTPNGGLTPLQAQIGLSLSPNRGLPTALFEIDSAALRSVGITPSLGPLQVLDTPTSAGGESEIIFDQRIPPEFLKRVR